MSDEQKISEQAKTLKRVADRKNKRERAGSDTATLTPEGPKGPEGSMEDPKGPEGSMEDPEGSMVDPKPNAGTTNPVAQPENEDVYIKVKGNTYTIVDANDTTAFKMVKNTNGCYELAPKSGGRPKTKKRNQKRRGFKSRSKK